MSPRIKKIALVAISVLVLRQVGRLFRSRRGQLARGSVMRSGRRFLTKLDNLQLFFRQMRASNRRAAQDRRPFKDARRSEA